MLHALRMPGAGRGGNTRPQPPVDSHDRLGTDHGAAALAPSPVASLGWRNGRTHPCHGRHARRRPRTTTGQGDGRGAVPGAGDGVPGGPRPARRRGGAHRTRRQQASSGADDQGRARAGPLRRPGDPRHGRGLDLRDPRVVRPGRDVGARRRAQDPGRRRRRPDVRRGQAPLREGAGPGRRRLARGQAAPGRHRGGRRPRPAAGGRLAVLQDPGPGRRDGGAPRPRAGHDRGPLPRVRRPAARALRQLVRVLPALRGRHRRRRRQGRQRELQDRRQAARRRRGDGLRRRSTCRRSTRSARSTARAPTTR